MGTAETEASIVNHHGRIVALEDRLRAIEEKLGLRKPPVSPPSTPPPSG